MYRVQIVAPGRTGIPEDQFVNTIYCSMVGGGDKQEVANRMAASLQAAYSDVAAGQTLALAAFMSGFIDKDNCQVRVYDMDEPKPRAPVTLPFAMIGGSGGHKDLPEEVALCLTIHGGNPVTPRRRGRLYIGPLNTMGLGGDTAGPLPSRPTTELVQVVRSFGESLSDSMDSFDLGWAIKSEVPALNYVQVVGGWVDDAWDTQRRRGVDPTVRWSWPAGV